MFFPKKASSKRRPHPFFYPFNLFAGLRHIPVDPSVTRKVPTKSLPRISPSSVFNSRFPPPSQKKIKPLYRKEHILRRPCTSNIRISLRKLRAQRSLRLRHAKYTRNVEANPISTTFGPLDEEVQHMVRELTRGDVPVLPDDLIFLKHLECMRIEGDFRKELFAARELAERAVEQAPRLEQERLERISRQLRAEDATIAARRAERQRREDELRRQEKERKQAQRRLFEEQVRREKEAIAQKAREAKERKEREGAARQQAIREQEALRQQQEALRRAQVEAAARLEAAERLKAQRHAYMQARAFLLYNEKWDALKLDKAPLPPLSLFQLPWPVFCDVTTPDAITYDAVSDYVFHPLRPGMENKSKRERLKCEMLRWHPDKFNSKVLGKVIRGEVAAVSKAAGKVARILTELMERTE